MVEGLSCQMDHPLQIYNIIQKLFSINISKLDLYLTFSCEKHYYMYVHAFICNKLFIR